jgi:ubiquinone/menaquinone biosynthesis C-methylase UbiE
LEVTGLDLDPAMIAHAQANPDRLGNAEQRWRSFLVGDVAALAFPDESCDLVVSTMSMHHWADPAAGLTEIGRVLRPGAYLGFPAWHPATSVRTTPCAPTRPARPHPRRSASNGERHSLALAVHPYSAHRALPGRWSPSLNGR